MAVDLWITQDLVWGVGGHDNIVCGPSYSSSGWQSVVYPSDANLPLSYNGSALNAETILASNPQVLIAQNTDPYVAPIQSTGLPIVFIDNSNSSQLMKSFQVIGEVLGGDSLTKAQQLVDYYNQTLSTISSKLSNYYFTSTTELQKPRVLILYLQPTAIYAYGATQAVGESVAICGGINADSGGVSTVNMEQILQWNPDIIIGGGALFNLTTMQNDPIWSALSAVQNGKVYAIPGGLWGWLGPSPEWILGIQWEAKLLNPTLFQDLNMTEQTTWFYTNFFGYSLTTTQANRMINALPPS